MVSRFNPLNIKSFGMDLHHHHRLTKLSNPVSSRRMRSIPLVKFLGFEEFILSEHWNLSWSTEHFTLHRSWHTSSCYPTPPIFFLFLPYLNSYSCPENKKCIKNAWYDKCTLLGLMFENIPFRYFKMSRLQNKRMYSVCIEPFLLFVFYLCHTSYHVFLTSPTNSPPLFPLPFATIIILPSHLPRVSPLLVLPSLTALPFSPLSATLNLHLFPSIPLSPQLSKRVPI